MTTSLLPSPTKAAADLPFDLSGEWAEAVRTGTHDVMRWPGRLLLLALGLFVLWSVSFKLGSAVVAEGTVIATGENKVLQHRTGGVITAILARDGETVEAGAVLVKLDPVHDQAELTRFKGRLAVLDAMRQRLEAENALASGGDAALGDTFRLLGPSKSATAAKARLGSTDPAVLDTPKDKLLQEQQRQFERGRGAAAAEIEAMVARQKALARRKAGVESRITSLSGQVASLDRQVNGMRPVVERGFIAKKTLWDAQDMLLARQGELASLKGEAEALAEEIDETGSRISQARLADQRQTSDKLTDVIAEINQISDQIRAAESAVRMADLRAPVAGTVVRMKRMTVGAVATPGEVLAEIVPAGSVLAIKARIPPTEITHVHVGQPGRAKLSALNARLYDDVPAVVTRVAADATTDEKTGQRYFEVEARLAPEQPGVHELLGVGMAGQLFIEGESRTFADYVMKPFVDSIGRTFRER